MVKAVLLTSAEADSASRGSTSMINTMDDEHEQSTI